MFFNHSIPFPMRIFQIGCLRLKSIILWLGQSRYIDKNSFFEWGFAPVSANMGFSSFLHLVFSRLYKSEKNKKTMRTTIIDVKFDGEFKSKLGIGLPCKETPENAENCRKIIKLLLEKNDVKKYLVHQ